MTGRHDSGALPMRDLGRTGLRVGILGVGGYHIGRPPDARTGVRVIRTAIDLGVNFLDNAWCYNKGRSETIMGRALRDGYRRRVVLMTKNHGRDAATFRKQLDESLRRLETDCLDIVQFHDFNAMSEVERIASGGALDAALEARRAGKVRFIGFTGHTDPAIHQRMLELRFPWDTVQLPVNVLDARYMSFQRRVVPELRRRGIGVIGMKSLASGELLKTGIAAESAIRYALSQPVDVLVSGMDAVRLVRQNVATARSLEPMGEAEAQELVASAAKDASDGHLEKYKP